MKDEETPATFKTQEAGPASPSNAVPPVNPSVRRVLIGDDCDEQRISLGRVLRGRGNNMLEASSGEEVVALYPEHAASIDVVLLDMQMPRMEVRDTPHARRDIDPHIEVGLMSGACAGARAESALREGALGFGGKLSSPSEVVAVLEASSAFDEMSSTTRRAPHESATDLPCGDRPHAP